MLFLFIKKYLNISDTRNTFKKFNKFMHSFSSTSEIVIILVVGKQYDIEEFKKRLELIIICPLICLLKKHLLKVISQRDLSHKNYYS